MNISIKTILEIINMLMGLLKGLLAGQKDNPFEE